MDAAQFIPYAPLTTCDTLNLPAGGFCQIAVQFMPTSAGVKQAQLTVFGTSTASVQLMSAGQ